MLNSKGNFKGEGVKIPLPIVPNMGQMEKEAGIWKRALDKMAKRRLIRNPYVPQSIQFSTIINSPFNSIST